MDSSPPLLERRLTKQQLGEWLGAQRNRKEIKRAILNQLIREGLPFVLSYSGKRKEFLLSQVIPWLQSRDTNRGQRRKRNP